MKIAFRTITQLILLFLALGAIYGGIMLIIDPSGKEIGWTKDLLSGTPFLSFLLPGIILLFFNGIFPLVIFILGTMRKSIWYLLVIFQGLILIIWLTSEVLMNIELYSPVMHPLFYSIALLLIFLGLYLKKFNQTQKINEK